VIYDPLFFINRRCLSYECVTKLLASTLAFSLSQISLVIYNSPTWVSSARKARTRGALGEKENNSRNSNLLDGSSRLLPWRVGEGDRRTAYETQFTVATATRTRVLGSNSAMRRGSSATISHKGFSCRGLGAVERTERNKNAERETRAHQTCNSDAPVVNYLAGETEGRRHGTKRERNGETCRDERARGEDAARKEPRTAL